MTRSSVRSLVVRTVHLAIGIVAAPVLFEACSTGPVPEHVGKVASGIAIAGLYDTGVDDTGVPLADGTVDPHYVLVSSADPSYPTPNVFVVNANFYGNNTGTAKWISADPDEGYDTQGLVQGDFQQRITFSLANVDPTTAVITGNWACDDTCKILLNGAQVASLTTANAWVTLVPFSIPAGSPFVLGTNTLDFVVTNGAPPPAKARNPSGIIVDKIAGVAFCTADNQCSAGQWCNNITTAGTCQSKTASGQLIPSGTCSVALAQRACASAMCDSGTNFCAECIAASQAACIGNKPICNTQAGLCASCNSDASPAPAGGTPALRCPAAAPYCTPSGGCSTACLNDSECATGEWCNDVSAFPHACQPKVANGSGIPGGACTQVLANRACVTGACDTNGNVCGIKINDKTCTTQVQCIDGTCILTGSNAGLCAPCTKDVDCALPKPVCSTKSSLCVQCSGANTTACTGGTPVCDVANETCVPCTGDFGSSTTAPCPNVGLPTCQVTTGECTASGPVDAGADAAPPDAGADAAPPADASAPVDAAVPVDAGIDAATPREGPVNPPDTSLDPLEDDHASLEGSGVCNMGTRGSPGVAAMLFVVACALARRRRAA